MRAAAPALARHARSALAQRGVTRLRDLHLSTLFAGGPLAAPSELAASITIVRQGIDGAPSGHGTRVFLCVFEPQLGEVQVLSLSCSEVSHIAALRWPRIDRTGFPGELMCDARASHEWSG